MSHQLIQNILSLCFGSKAKHQVTSPVIMLLKIICLHRPLRCLGKMWLDLPFAQVSRSVEQNMHTTFSFPNSLSDPEELQASRVSKMLLSFLIWFDGYFWPNQQQQQNLRQFESILKSQRSRHIPAPFRLKIENFICSNSRVSVVVRPALKQNFMVTICSFPPSMTYKENWPYKISYDSYTVKNKQKKICVWTNVCW
jgi:hypothetical protein